MTMYAYKAFWKLQEKEKTKKERQTEHVYLPFSEDIFVWIVIS